MLTYKTAGESHGKGIAALVEGFPAGVTLDYNRINAELLRRQGGYGRGARQQIERDKVEFCAGTYKGVSTGAPILLGILNRDFSINEKTEPASPRPGHADLVGAMKYGVGIRPVLERASARETSGRVAAGAMAAGLLDAFGICALGFVTHLGGVSLDLPEAEKARMNPDTFYTRREESIVYSIDAEKDEEAEVRIDQARDHGDTLGGVIEVRVFGVPAGLGSHVQWDRKLDARLAQAAMSVQAIKGVEIGMGFESAFHFGSEVHDPILRSNDPSNNSPFTHATNNAGGIEGGTSNGETIIVKAAMKPIATLRSPLESVDLATGLPTEASFERSDICAVSAASVVLENVVAFEIAAALLEKLGGDSLDELLERYNLLKTRYQNFLKV